MSELSGLFDNLSPEFEDALLRLVSSPFRDTLIERMDVHTRLNDGPQTEVTVAPRWDTIAQTLKKAGDFCPATILWLYLHLRTEQEAGVWLSITACPYGWVIEKCSSTEYLSARFPTGMQEPEEWISWDTAWDIHDYQLQQICRDDALAIEVVKHFAETGELSPKVEWVSS